MTMIKLYAPADTENVPILRKKERKQKKMVSYIILTVKITDNKYGHEVYANNT